MKKILLSLSFASLAILPFTSCDNDIENNISEISNESEVNFIIGINNLSRTVDEGLTTKFVAGDEVGIFAYNGTEKVGDNVKYTFDGSKWTSETAIKTSSDVQLKYYAYYPYSQTVTDPAAISITINSDQSNRISKDDILTAKNETAEAGANNISLNFSHMFSMVQVGIKPEATQDANTSVALTNIKPTAVINLIDGTVGEASGETVSVKMRKTADKLEYRAIVPAQTIANGTQILSVNADGKEFSVSPGVDVEYAKGKALQITVNSLNKLPEGNEVTIGGSITDWEQGTDPGDGEPERVFTDLIPLKLNDFNNADFKNLNNDPNINDYEESFWFSLNKVAGNTTTYTCESDPTYGNIITVDYKGDKTSWYNNFVGYYNPNKTNIIKPEKIYTLSFKAKADNAATGKPAIWTCIKMVKENFFCTIESATIENITVDKNLTFKNFNITEEWTEFSFNFKFSLLGDKSGSGASCTTYKTWEDLSIYDYFINLAPRGMDTKYYIADVKLIEKE